MNEPWKIPGIMPRLPLKKLSSRKGVVELKADAVVVGSGAGGAAVALRLSEKGMKVLVLEEGGLMQNTDFTQREEEMIPRLHRDVGSQWSVDGSIVVLQGRTVGGTTTINYGDATPIEKPVLAYWRKSFGWDMSDDELDKAQSWTMEHLGVNPIPPHLINKQNSDMLRVAKEFGWKAGVFDHFRMGCIGSGYCMIGCHYDAKRGVLLNILPMAVSKGAEVLTGARVDRVLLESGVAKGVEGSFLKEGSYREAGGRFKVMAPRVIVSASTIHSPSVLHRSGIHHPELGKNLTLQPHFPFFAVYPQEQKNYRGIPQSAYVSEFDETTEEGGLLGYRFEPAMVQPGQVGSGLFGHGRDHLEVMSHYGQLALTLILVPDRPTGEIKFKDGRSVIDYSPKEDVFERVRKAIPNISRLHFQAGADFVYVPIKGGYKAAKNLEEVKGALKELRFPRFISPHPQGSIRMGKDPEKSVLDLQGRVRGQKNLWVLDGSIFPSSSSHHVTVPIVSLSSFLAEKID